MIYADNKFIPFQGLFGKEEASNKEFDDYDAKSLLDSLEMKEVSKEIYNEIAERINNLFKKHEYGYIINTPLST